MAILISNIIVGCIVLVAIIGAIRYKNPYKLFIIAFGCGLLWVLLWAIIGAGIKVYNLLVALGY